MRKLLKSAGILTAGILISAAAAGAAQAGTVTTNCTVFPVSFSGGVGSTTVSCPGFSGGGTLTAASLTLIGDYQFGNTPGTNDIKISFGVSAPAGVTWADSAPFVDVTGGFSSGATSPIIDDATGGITNGNFASAFLVGVSSSVVSGGAFSSTGAVKITYTFSETVPEPITLSLFGAGLAGAAALRRRKKKIA